MAKWADLANTLRAKLWLKTHPVGFRRFDDADEIDKIPGLKRMEHFFVLCQMIAQARKWGITVGAKNTDTLYSHCGQIHGLREIPPGMKRPEYGLVWCSRWEDEEKRFKAFPRLPFGGAVVLAPLATATFDPEVILVYGNPMQIILIIQSMQKKAFERFEFACIGESSCADSLVDCYLSGKPRVGLPGFGERVFGNVGDEELVIALPPSYLEKAVAGLHELNINMPLPCIDMDMDVRPILSHAYPDNPELKL